MVGTISLYDALENANTRLSAPEYGKASFLERLEREIGHTPVIPKLPIRIADGAAANWQFLNRHTATGARFLSCFWLSRCCSRPYPKDLTQQQQWLNQTCHQLKHDSGAAAQLYEQMRELSQSQRHPQTIQDNLSAAVTYFRTISIK